MNKVERIKELIKILNEARDNYYNHSNKNGISDYTYDQLFDELEQLEKETGLIMTNSPTQTVGYAVQDKLKKVTHQYPMLSLDKTKDVNELISFVKDKDAILMFKMDGLSVCATYDIEGNLILCETRGDGVVGSDITENAKTFVNLPKKINHKGGLVVFGEAIIDYPTFYSVNEKLPEDSRYKNPRNLCSGSVQVLDPKVCAERKVKFIAWRLVEGYNENIFYKRLNYLHTLGFEIVPYISMDKNCLKLEQQLNEAFQSANRMGYGIDGVVCSFDDVKYMESLGATSHHLRGQIAWKATEDREFTTLRSIEWSPSRTGQLNPVAIFDTIELAGTEVSRASLSNISIMKEYNIKIGAQVEVCKRNEIIPKIESCDGVGADVIIPDTCPVCGGKTEIITSESGTQVLICTNENCSSKLLGKLELFCSKEAMDIKGLSTSQLQTFINRDWLNDISDIYNLHNYKKEMSKLSGFGVKSVTKLLEAIENSRLVTLDKFVRSLGINLIGRSASKDLTKYVNGDITLFEENINSRVDFSSKIDGFGEKMNKSLYDWFDDELNRVIYNKLKKELTFIDKNPGVVTQQGFNKFMNAPEGGETKQNNNDSNKYKDLSGMNFVITGALHHFKNRDELKELLESLGVKVSGSVSSKTTALLNNDINSTSSKNKKAKELNIPIMDENTFIEFIKE